MQKSELTKKQEKIIMSIAEDIDSIVDKHGGCEDVFMCLACASGMGYAELGIPFYDLVDAIGHAYRERVEADVR